ncbi:MAG: hypothetical protein ABH850_03985 [Candidatus Micrarchaeota archaeon]
MNPVNVIFKPGRTVKEYLEKPDLFMAFVFVLLPSVISLLGLVLYGLEINFFNILFGFLAAILSWIIASVVLSIIISLFAKKNMRTEFYGIASAVSLTRFLAAIVVILFLFFPLILPNQIFDSVKDFQSGEISLNESVDAITASVNSQEFDNAFSLIALIILLVVVLVLISVYVFYRIISEKMHSNFLLHLIALIIFLVFNSVLLTLIGL